jgi:hypothetical protein
MTQEAFKAWWYTEGSQAPYTHHDCEEHTMRMCEIAWNEAVKAEREAFAKIQFESILQAIKIEREACKQIIRETPFSNWFQADVIEAIDKRGQA